MTCAAATLVAKAAVINKGATVETVFANEILQRMARERNCTVPQVIAEYLEHQVNGQCQHFWPDQNEACRFVLENG